MFVAVTLVLAGVAGLVAPLIREHEDAQERGLVTAMESVVCQGNTCDIETGCADN
jgi:hypothetical protein